MNISKHLVVETEGVQVLLDPILGEELGLAADTCCKEAIELQHDVEAIHTSGAARLWRSPSQACPRSSIWTYTAARSVQRLLRPGKSSVLPRSPGQAGAADSRAYLSPRRPI